MMLRSLLIALGLAGSLAGQTFIQMSDPQFGMFTMSKRPYVVAVWTALHVRAQDLGTASLLPVCRRRVRLIVGVFLFVLE